MGRELKRVPMDFDWPMDRPWRGFLNPHYAKSHNCAACGGSGETVAAQRVGDLMSLVMLSGDDAARNKCHPYLQEAPLYNTRGKICGADMVALTNGLAGQKHPPLGYCSSDRWSAKKKLVAAAGLPEDWGICPACKGEGTVWDSPADKQASEDWERSEPPTGPGYQIWETVSEGSPISPVFATPEELAQHMTKTRWGADKGSSVETWLRFINGPGWAPSMVMDANGIRTGADAAL